MHYLLLLGLDGAASLGGKQISYKIYDEKGTLLNKCGEIEEHAFTYFMESRDPWQWNIGRIFDDRF